MAFISVKYFMRMLETLKFVVNVARILGVHCLLTAWPGIACSEIFRENES